MKVAEEHLRADAPMITLATAHPAKFPDAVEAATGHRPPLPPRMADLYDRPERMTAVANDLAALEALIKEAHRRSERRDSHTPVQRLPHRHRAHAGPEIRRASASGSAPAAGTSGSSRTASRISSSTWPSRAPTRRSALQIAEAIEDVGGYINAYTRAR